MPGMKLSKNLFFVIGLFVSVTLYGQNASDLSLFLNASKQDASNLVSGYMSPVIKAFSYGMTNGWYHTAKTHKSLGVDLGVTFSAVMVPTSDNYFTPPQTPSLAFANNTNPSLQMAPSIVGPKDQTTYTASYTPPGHAPVSLSFNGPEGLDLKKNFGISAIPVPMVQLGIGTIKNTDLKLRMVPSINRNGNTINMFGIGLMHDIKQYLPGVKALPFDLSVLAGYNSIKGSSSLASSGGSVPSSTDGKISYTLNSWVAQVLISKKVSVLTLYAGVGYGSVSTKVDITGTYTVTPTVGSAFQIIDPLAYNLNNTGAKLTGGMRLKFGPIYLNGDYTLQKYSAVTIGLGVSVR